VGAFTSTKLGTPSAPNGWPAYAAMCADAEVMRYIGPGEVESPEDAWRTIAAILGHWALLGYGMWALERCDSDALLGRVGYIDRPGWPGFELGWLLARGHWGHGYAREAAGVALRHAFELLQRERVISLFRPRNRRSVAVAEANGETQHGNIQLMGGQTLVYEERLGAFATEAIAPSRKIGEIRGESISVAAARIRASRHERIMIVELSPKRAIDLSKSADPMRYTNHSCRRNTWLSIAQGRVEFYAAQPIAQGDEITVNYGETHHQGQRHHQRR